MTWGYYYKIRGEDTQIDLAKQNIHSVIVFLSDCIAIAYLDPMKTTYEIAIRWARLALLNPKLQIGFQMK